MSKNTTPTPTVPPMEPNKKNTSKNSKILKIVIPTIAVILVVVAVIVAIALKGDKDNIKGDTSTTEKIMYVTDTNGFAVTDDAGMAVTVVPDTTIVNVTDENGKIVKDKDGNKLTTVMYQNIDVTVNVPVTKENGIVVTKENGDAQTEQVVLPQDPNKQNGNLVMGTTSVAVTDGVGNTAVDGNGNIHTTIVELTSNPTPVAPASIDWKTSLGGTDADYFSSIATLKDGGYIASNVTNSKNGNFEKFAELKYATPYTVLVKYDKNGREVWSQAIGSKRGLTILTDVVATDDGGFYAVGYGKNIGGVSGKGYYDGAVYKFDKNGNQEWFKTFGTSTVDLFNAAFVTNDGGVVIAGSVGNNNGDAAGFNKPANQSAACVVKYSSSGDLVWKNIIGGNKDTFKDVCQSADGSIFCIGQFYSDELFKNLGKTDGGIVKFTPNGKYSASLQLAGSNNDLFSGIAPCSGGVVVVGRSNSSDVGSANPDSIFTENLGSRGGYDAYIIKIAENMNISFARAFRGQYDDDLVDVVEREDGSFIVVGSSNSSTRDFKGITTRGGDDIVIASFDKRGILSWARSFGGTADESASSVCLSQKGGYVVAGRTLSKNIDMDGITQYVNGKSVGVIAKFPE